MKHFINSVRAFMIAVAAFAITATAFTVPVYADNAGEVKKGIDAVGGTGADNSATGFTNLIESVINILLFVIGAVAVIMIIIGGIRYTTSNGDQSQVTSAKNTILYAIIGLVVAIMAYAIVNFVVSKI